MKTVTITGIMADFLDSIRAYEHESGKAIHFDERESSAFVNMYFNNGGKLKIEEKKLLFVTEDGVKMLDRDSIVWMVRNKTLEKIKIHSIHLNECDFEHKVFAHESNADQYIWRNKRVFSYEDFIRWGNVPYERVIMQLAKERSEE